MIDQQVEKLLRELAFIQMALVDYAGEIAHPTKGKKLAKVKRGVNRLAKGVEALPADIPE